MHTDWTAVVQAWTAVVALLVAVVALSWQAYSHKQQARLALLDHRLRFLDDYLRFLAVPVIAPDSPAIRLYREAPFLFGKAVNNLLRQHRELVEHIGMLKNQITHYKADGGVRWSVSLESLELDYARSMTSLMNSPQELFEVLYPEMAVSQSFTERLNTWIEKGASSEQFLSDLVAPNKRDGLTSASPTDSHRHRPTSHQGS